MLKYLLRIVFFIGLCYIPFCIYNQMDLKYHQKILPPNLVHTNLITILHNDTNTNNLFIYFSSKCPLCKDIHIKYLSIMEKQLQNTNIYLKLLTVSPEDIFLYKILQKELNITKRKNIIHDFFTQKSIKDIIQQYNIIINKKEEETILQDTINILQELDIYILPIFIVNNKLLVFNQINNNHFINIIDQKIKNTA